MGITIKTKNEVESFLEKVTKMSKENGIVIESGKVYFKKPEDTKNAYLKQFIFNHHSEKYELMD